MYICFLLSNLTKTECDKDIVETFNQKLVEEGERIEIGYVGILRDVLAQLYIEKKTKPEYITEAKLVKISNKEIYDTFNAKLKKEQDQGVSPAKFKEYMLEFGFTDALNRSKQKVPIPSDSEPKSRLCNIFTDRVLRKIGVDKEMEDIEKAIVELASKTPKLERLEHEDSQGECVCCHEKGRLDYQATLFDGSYGLLCGPCGIKLIERLNRNE